MLIALLAHRKTDPKLSYLVFPRFQQSPTVVDRHNS